MPISTKPPLKKINTVHNFITFSIVFTNKNGGINSTSPPINPPVKNIKTKVITFTFFLIFSYKILRVNLMNQKHRTQFHEDISIESEDI